MGPRRVQATWQLLQQGGPDTLTHGTFGGSHVYADDGSYTVTVTVTDDDAADPKDILRDGHECRATLIVAGNQTANEGSTLTITDIGKFTDPGFAEPCESWVRAGRDLHVLDELG